MIFIQRGRTGERANQLRTKLSRGDRIAGMKDVHDGPRLVYAIIGILVVDDILLPTSVPESAWNSNAHSRRILAEGAQDIIVRGRQAHANTRHSCEGFIFLRNMDAAE
jgi:hypothetical protein